MLPSAKVTTAKAWDCVQITQPGTSTELLSLVGAVRAFNFNRLLQVNLLGDADFNLVGKQGGKIPIKAGVRTPIPARNFTDVKVQHGGSANIIVELYFDQEHLDDVPDPVIASGKTVGQIVSLPNAQIGPMAGGSESFWFMARVLVDALTGNQAIAGVYETVGNQRSWAAWIESDGDVRLQISDDGTTTINTASTITPIDAGRWHTVLCEWHKTDGVQRVYVDNRLVATIANTVGGFAASTADLQIGAANDSLQLAGHIQQFLFGQGELTALQRAEVWNRGIYKPVGEFSAGVREQCMHNGGFFELSTAENQLKGYIQGKDRYLSVDSGNLTTETAPDTKVTRLGIVGDSRLAGGGSGVTTDMAAEIAANHMTDATYHSFVDLSTGGDRITHFQTDWNTMKNDGLTHVLFLGGVNNIRDDDPYTLITTFIQTLHDESAARGIVPIICNELPWGNYVGGQPWTEARDAEHKLLKAWIDAETNTPYGRVINTFDIILETVNLKDIIEASYDSGDGLHPNNSWYEDAEPYLRSDIDL